MNLLSITTQNKKSINKIYNTACGEQTNLLELVNYLKTYLAKYDSKIENIPVIHGPVRDGDIPHSLASIKKAKLLLDYEPTHLVDQGLRESIDWYWNNL